MVKIKVKNLKLKYPMPVPFRSFKIDVRTGHM